METKKKHKKLSTAVIVVKPYVNNKTGKEAIMYYAVAGNIPNRNVVDPIIAKNEGFELNQKYEVDIVEVEPDDVYGRRFLFKNVGIWTGSAKSAKLEYGEGTVIPVEGSALFTAIGEE